MGTDLVLHEIRLTIWIIWGCEQVKRVRKECDHLAKRRTVIPVVPREGNLPVERLRAYIPVFSEASIDFYGPVDWRLMMPLIENHRENPNRLFCSLHIDN